MIEIILSALVVAGLVASARAGFMDAKEGRWFWAILDGIGLMAMLFGLALFWAVYGFTPTGL